ncbi:MAG: hypothetical protein EOM25_12370 [Deltaproteobacteria bacterium]|nr:hypothetical protein [Deltaproteobacteria bacterium]
MGWTYMQKPKNVKAYFESQLNLETDEAIYRPLELKMVSLKALYGAVGRISKQTGKSDIFAVVILLKFTKENGVSMLGYKDMDETMGPVESECPESILLKLTETDSEYAKEWRLRCWARVKLVKQRKEKSKVGAVLVPKADLTLQGWKVKQVEVVDSPYGKALMGVRFCDTERPPTYYRIANWVLDRCDIQ